MILNHLDPQNPTHSEYEQTPKSSKHPEYQQTIWNVPGAQSSAPAGVLVPFYKEYYNYLSVNISIIIKACFFYPPRVELAPLYKEYYNYLSVNISIIIKARISSWPQIVWFTLLIH